MSHLTNSNLTNVTRKVHVKLPGKSQSLHEGREDNRQRNFSCLTRGMLWGKQPFSVSNVDIAYCLLYILFYLELGADPNALDQNGFIFWPELTTSTGNLTYTFSRLWWTQVRISTWPQITVKLNFSVSWSKIWHELLSKASLPYSRICIRYSVPCSLCLGIHTCQWGIDANWVIDPAAKCNCDALAPLQLVDDGVLRFPHLQN
jgi:hypothetical protein